MNHALENLSTVALRALIIQETRKFSLALEYGSTLSDLVELRDYIRTLTEALQQKENQEVRSHVGQNNTHSLPNHFASSNS